MPGSQERHHSEYLKQQILLSLHVRNIRQKYNSYGILMEFNILSIPMALSKILEHVACDRSSLAIICSVQFWTNPM